MKNVRMQLVLQPWMFTSIGMLKMVNAFKLMIYCEVFESINAHLLFYVVQVVAFVQLSAFQYVVQSIKSLQAMFKVHNS